ncbi:MAG: hypothetical protein AB9866_21755 [Syntrophobacteraceae bacterium]
MSEEKNGLVKKTIITGLAFLGLVALYIFGPSLIPFLPDKYLELIKHLLLLLCAMLGVHFLERTFLWKDIAKWNKESLKDILNPAIELLGASNQCGLDMIYVDRTNLKEEVVASVKHAKKRVWMLGIAFSEEIRLKDILPHASVSLKHNPGFDFRILLLDVLRSPAIFRAFLESSPEKVKEMLEFNRQDGPSSLDPYKYVRMFQDFNRVYPLVKDDTYKHHVRYYGHNPNCWMILVDDTVFFQPYTFGRGSIPSEQKECIGALMPVFKFKDKDGCNTFNIIEDHFIKMWLTSNIDIFHIKARFADADAILRRIFEERKAWLSHVYGSLHLHGPSCNLDRRKCPRICANDLQIAVNTIQGNSVAKILNYSESGVCLECSSDTNIIVGDAFNISLSNKTDGLHKFGIGQISGSKFEAVWANAGTGNTAILGGKIKP